MSTNTTPPGRLYLVPTPLDFGCAGPDLPSLSTVLPLHTVQVASGLGHWVTENAKSTRAFLKRVDAVCPLHAPLQTLQLQELPREVHKKGDHQSQGGFDARPLLAPAVAGHDVALVSEAGMPAVADPGASVVRAAHALGVPVVPLVGPVSLVLALAASGLEGQRFAFVGYVPQDPAGAQAQRLRELEALSRRLGQTQLMIETPYRNAALLRALLAALAPATRLSVSCGLTLPTARNRSLPVKEWKKLGAEGVGDAPAVFAIGR